MKKTVISFILIFIILGSQSSVLANQSHISTYDETYQNFARSAREYDVSGVGVREYSNEGENNSQKLFKKIYDVFIKEIRESWQMFFYVMFVCILSSLLKSFVCKTNLAEVGGYGCYCVCASLIVYNFKASGEVCSEAIYNLSDFMDLTIPTFASVLAGCGYGSTAVSMQGIFVVISVFITHIIEKIIFPLLFCCGLLSVVSGISTTIELTRFIKLISKTVKYIMGITMTIFAGTLAFTGLTASAGDNLVFKTAKYAVSNFVPVVGGCLSDALNSIVYSSQMVKSSIGYIGYFTLLSICLVPIVKTMVIIFSFKISASAAEMLSESKLSSMLDSVSDILVAQVGMVMLVTVIFILTIGILASIV